MGRGRPKSAVSQFILSLPGDLAVAEVIARAKAKGLKTTANNTYRVRRLAAKASKAAAKANGATVAAPKGASQARGANSAESLLRAVAAELGLGRALEILEAERSRVRALLRG